MTDEGLASQSDPVADIQEQQRYYDERWSSVKYGDRFRLQRALAILRCLKQTDLQYPKMLDLGAGTGSFTSILSQFGPTTGIELSPAAVEQARRKYPTAQFVSGNLFDLKIEQGAYDVVVSQEVIEHVEDQGRYLDIAADSLRPGGFLILTTPNAFVQRRRTREELAPWGLQPVENWISPRELRSLLRRRFKVLLMDSVILNIGHKGILRVVNSSKLRRLAPRPHLSDLFDRFRERHLFGLHLLALCQRVG